MRSVQDTDRLVAAQARLMQTLGLPGDTSQPTDSALDQASIPVTLISGFLGAGKTTLLTRLLSQPQLRFTAVVNDIASINIDAAHVRSRGIDTIQLQNGCACCALGDDLTDSLNPIADRTDPPAGVVIETSGLSDPQGITQSIARHPRMALDGVVVLVDVRTALTRLKQPLCRELMQRQLDCAHLVFLTHLTDDDDRATVMEVLMELAPGRRIVALDEDADPTTLVTGAALKGARPTPAEMAHDTGNWQSIAMSLSRPVSADALFSLLHQIPADVLRIKGTFSTTRGGRALQAVGNYWRLTPEREPLEQLVIIGVPGPGLDRFTRQLRGLGMRVDQDPDDLCFRSSSTQPS